MRSFSFSAKCNHKRYQDYFSQETEMTTLISRLKIIGMLLFITSSVFAAPAIAESSFDAPPEAGCDSVAAAYINDFL